MAVVTDGRVVAYDAFFFRRVYIECAFVYLNSSVVHKDTVVFYCIQINFAVVDGKQGWGSNAAIATFPRRLNLHLSSVYLQVSGCIDSFIATVDIQCPVARKSQRADALDGCSRILHGVFEVNRVVATQDNCCSVRQYDSILIFRFDVEIREL